MKSGAIRTFIPVLIVTSLAGCQTISGTGPGDAKAGGAFQDSISDIEPKFDIIQNNGNHLQIDVAGLKDGSKPLKYSLVIDEHRYDEDTRKNKHSDGTLDVPDTNELAFNTHNLGSGTYTFKFYRKERLRWRTVWEQDVFVLADNNWPEQIRDPDFQKELAAKYAPVLMFNEQEEYFPVTIPYLANTEDESPELDQEIYKIRGNRLIVDYFAMPDASIFNKPFRHVIDNLPYVGDRRTSLNLAIMNFEYRTRSKLAARFGDKKNITVYHSLLRMHERDNNSNSYREKDIYVMYYHFLYAFDPKDGKLNSEDSEQKINAGKVAGHIFDRESMGIVLRYSTAESRLEPISVVYGAHLASQTMALKSTNDTSPFVSVSDIKDKYFQSWQGGRIKFDWNHKGLLKKGNHPVISIAKGSHAVYPYPGTYNVLGEPKLGKVFVQLQEIAGPSPGHFAGSVVFPDKNSGLSYNLKTLNIGRHTSSDPYYGLLVYSGGLVDVLSPIVARLPPFTDRERKPEEWAIGKDLREWSENPSDWPKMTDEYNQVVGH